MPIVPTFYNALTRKYIAVFGTIFNKIEITRIDNNGVEQQSLFVPIAYGPREKYLARIKQDPEFKRQAIQLPRMSFEITSMGYDSTRKLASTQRILNGSTNPDVANSIFAPVPYDIEFTLTIMAKYSEDGVKILEQITPFFSPELTSSVKLMDDLPLVDVPVILSSVTSEEVYEGDFTTRIVHMWTLNFTMKANFYGPVRQSKVIKFIDVRMFDNMNAGANDYIEKIVTRPGLTANGDPTTSLTDTIAYQDIDFGDDWGVITYTETNQ